jgi:hypothetical protein
MIENRKKLWLGIAGLAGMAMAVTFGLAHAMPSEAESQAQSTAAFGREFWIEAGIAKGARGNYCD